MTINGMDRWRCAGCRLMGRRHQATLAYLTLTPDVLGFGYHQEIKCPSCNTMNLVEVDASDTVVISYVLPHAPMTSGSVVYLSSGVWPRLVDNNLRSAII